MDARGQKLADPGLFVSSMLLLLVDLFGVECLHWEPETMEMELKSACSRQPPSAMLDKAHAACALAGSNIYHRSLEAFMALNAAMNLRPVTTAAMVSDEADVLLWGVTEAKLIEGPEEFNSWKFTHDIGRYTGLVLSQEGLTDAPRGLDFAEFPEPTRANSELVAIDDPMMSETYNAGQQSVKTGMETHAAQRLALLMEQFGELPLSGDAHGFKERAAQALEGLKKDLEQEEDYASLD